jgi:hypothetical protein
MHTPEGFGIGNEEMLMVDMVLYSEAQERWIRGILPSPATAATAATT